MSKLHASELEKEQQTFIGFRKDAQLGTEITRRDQKAAKGRESLQERSIRNRTTTQRRHEINKSRKELLGKLIDETTAEQDEMLKEEFERNL